MFQYMLFYKTSEVYFKIKFYKEKVINIIFTYKNKVDFKKFKI